MRAGLLQEQLFLRAFPLCAVLGDGGAAEISVSGAEPEVPGDEGEPWEETYSFGDPSAP